MRQPLIQVVRVDLKGVERQLARIATALEMAVGMVPAAPEPVESAADPAVSYATEGDLIRQEWEALQGVPVEEEP